MSFAGAFPFSLSFLKFFLLGLLSLKLIGCNPFYVMDMGLHQFQVLTQRVSVDEVLRGTTVSEANKEKLKWIALAKAFGEEQIGLTPNKNYTLYYDTQGKPIAYNVIACAPDQFEIKLWWFPLLGTLPYLGFFEKEKAVALQNELIEEGYDVFVSEVAGYSTLGWFADPVFSSMLDKNDIPSLVNLILHEQTHSTLYLKNQSAFNETFANFIADKGTLLLLQQQQEEEEEEEEEEESNLIYLALYQKEQKEKEVLRQLLVKTQERLQEVYEASFLTSEEKIRWKRRILADMTKEYQYLQKHILGESYPKNFPLSYQNNAYLSLFHTYHREVEWFEKMYQAHQGDLRKTLQTLKKILNPKEDAYQTMEKWLKENPPP
jgi:predicted aminopeptidase